MEALDRLLLVPVAPPLHDVDPQVVLRWAEAASEALLYRRERRWLVRQVLRVLEEEWATSQEIERLYDQIAAREEEQRQREEGAYWERRESGRRAQRPIRVDVDPEAWARAKGAARREGLGIGEYVGRLIAAETARRPDHTSAFRGAQPGRRRGPERERFFARVAVGRDTWAEFVARSHDARITVARYVGLVVEAAVNADVDGPQRLR